jgi:hypothetical protein
MSSLENFVKKYKNVLFESSSFETPVFAKFASSFRRALRKDVKESPFEVVRLSKGHFEISGFLKHKESGKFIYFAIPDVRWSTLGTWYDHVLYRTAKDDRDFTGGHNNFCPLSKLLDSAEALVPRDMRRRSAC